MSDISGTTTSLPSAPSATFRALHTGPAILLLPNVWDAASARLVEVCGAAAVATSSAAVSWAHGVADGEHLTRDVLVRSIREIAAVVRIPLSVDLEGGYSDDPNELDDLVREVLDAGAVGVNLEDGGGPPASLCAKIERARRVSTQLGVDLFVNARTDVYLRGLAPPAERAAATLARAQLYRDAGCDGLFVPGLSDPAEITAVVAAARLPVNLMTTPGLAPPPRLQAMGVRRLSVGTALSRAAWGLVRRLSRELLQGAGYGALFDDPAGYAEMNELFPSAAGVSGGGPATRAHERASTMRLVEVRSYTLRAGSGAEFHRLVTERSAPLQRRHGIDVVAHGCSVHDPDAYYLVRAYRDLEHLRASQAEFYATDEWKRGPRQPIVDLITSDANAVFWLDEGAVKALRAQSAAAEAR